MDALWGTTKQKRPANFGSPAKTQLRLLDSNRPEVLQSRGLIEDSRADESTRIDVSPRELVAFGPNESEAVDNVEEALAFALAEAARAGNWDVVSQLARLLEA